MIRILTTPCLKTNSYRYSGWKMLLIFLLFTGKAGTAFSQTGNSVKPPAIIYNLTDTSYTDGGSEDEYEEISITLNVPRIGSTEIPVIISGENVYLSVKDLFDFLKIRNTVSPDADLVQGFFMTPQEAYYIDKTNNRVFYKYKTYTLPPKDIIRTETSLYLRSDYFGQIFGLQCDFDFRGLSVTLTTKIELPAIREMQQQQMRRNISQLKGEKKADTLIQRRFPLFHLGMADWFVISTQETKGLNNTRLNLGIGAVVAGGQTDLLLNYNSNEPLSMRQQFYQWRLVNNDNSALRQITAGKIFAQSTASVFAPVIGLQFTNTPTTYKRSFGTYTLSNITEPEWMVELYVNNVLVDYKKADASGFFSFEVPMVYGNSIVRLRFYGPWGEERTSERYITVPFNFMPLHQFEYNVTAGVVDNDSKSRYSRVAFNYGMSQRMTIGGGIEYLSSVTTGKTMPFVNASLRLGQHILVSGEHMYGVRSKGIINYRLPSNFQLDFNYTRYENAQTAVLFNFLDEKKLVLSMPFRGKKLTAFSRFTLNQFTLPFSNSGVVKTNDKYTSAEFLLSAVVSGISSNLTTNAILSNPGSPAAYTSNLSLTFRLPKGIRFTPQAQYEYQQKNFSVLKAEVEKSVLNRGFFNIAYERTFVKQSMSLITMGLRYNFSFAQTFFSATKRLQSIATTQSARGSLMYDGKTAYIGATSQTSVGRGGIIILPFLDLNCNGRRDAAEPKAFGLKLQVNGGYVEHHASDTTIRISRLEAYTNYYVELDKASFDNIAWRIKKPTLSVAVDPNSFKLVEVAVAVVGEASGKVSLYSDKGITPLGRVIVTIYNRDSVLVARVLTEADGFFDFIGLAPGEYTARVDAAQLIKLGMTSSPVLSFKISQNTEGDIVDNLEFLLRPDPANAPPVPTNK